MKFQLVVVLAVIGLAVAQLPDSATQGPNPQDIATPEPEYIDIDLPESSRSAASAPAPAPLRPQPIARPIARPVVAAPAFYAAPVQHAQYLAPVHAAAPIVQYPAHSYSQQSGYQYRRPVYVRRFYRLHRY